MEMTITNFNVQKSINIELPDEIAEDIDNTRIIIGTEQFKLVSTKSEEEKLREKAAVEFGEEAYDIIYQQYPDFGKPECKVTREEMGKIIIDRLKSYGDRFKVLLEDKSIDQLKNGLVTAYANYCVVRERMAKEDELIEKSKLDDNVFFDYILRFKKAFKDATCIKDVHESILHLHKCAGIDKRELFGYTFIFDCMSVFYDKIKEIEDELAGMKPVQKLQESPIYTDKEYWNDVPMQEVVAKVIAKFDELEVKYRKQEEITVPVFEYFARMIINEYNLLIDKQDAVNKYLKSISDETGKISNVTVEQTEAITNLVKAVNDAYRNMLINLADIRIRFNVENREWNHDDHTIINANFGLIDFWTQTMQTTPEKDKINKLNQMIAQFRLHSNILTKICERKINTHDLVAGKFSNEELIKLVNDSSK
ncbi:MAG: hypothetical protein IKA36_02495 [Clostridia bacterium]|nr:hypothetical protein [Clostridia bacterium]